MYEPDKGHAPAPMSDLPVAAAYEMVRPHVPSDNIRGGLWILGSAFAFTLSMTLVKLMGPGYPSAMQAFVRQFVGLLVLLPFIARSPRVAFRTNNAGLFLARGVATSTAVVLSFYSYEKLPLAEANALSFTRALWIVPFAFLMLRERTGWLRVAATVVGLGGVLLILRPTGAQGLPFLPVMYGLAGAALMAFSVTGIKSLSRSHNQLQLLAWAGVLGTLFTLPTAIPVWRLPDLKDGLLLTVMGITGVASQFCYIKGLSMGDATILSNVDYARIIMAAILGFVLFHEVPPLMTWAGAAVIVGSAVLITWHSHRRTALDGP